MSTATSPATAAMNVSDTRPFDPERRRPRAARLLATAALLSALLAPAASSAGTTTTQAAGGPGGVPYHIACAPKEVLIGLVMNATVPTAPMVQWLESAYPICAAVGSGGTWAGVHYYPTSSVGGWSASERGGPAATAQNTRACPQHSAVIGFKAYAGTFLDRLQLVCRKLVDTSHTTGEAVSLPWFPDAAPDVAMRIPEATCGNLRFEMRPGETIDRLVARVANQLGDNVKCLNPFEWKVTETSKPVASGPDVLPRQAGGPAEVARTDCPGMRPATGVYGKAGALVARVVDSLGLKCIDEAVWRPGYHFSPAHAWMNDPAGLVFLNDTYHLHYQAIPSPSPVSSTIFGADKMTWAHATSTNLLKWTERSAVFHAKNPQGLDESPFTGSAVVLNGNDPPCSCGTGRCIAAVFTRHKLPAGPQRQVVATSCNNGPDQDPYRPAEPGLAVLQAPGEPMWQPWQFRDPKVVWYQDPQKAPTGYWVMAVAAGDRIKVYRSCSPSGCTRGLTTWEPVQEIFIEQVIPRFQGPRPVLSGPFFETPDLVELPVQNELGVTKWALLFAKGWMPPFVPVAGRDEYSESWYHVLTEVDVPGRSAPQFQLTGSPRRLDAGPDFYAGQTWFIEPSAPPVSAPAIAPGPSPRDTAGARPPLTSLRPTARRILGGWQNNWRYAHELPTSRWKGHLSIPRELSMIKEGTEYLLLQQPIRELSTLRVANRPATWQVRNAAVPGSYGVPGFAATQYEALLSLEVPAPASNVQVHVRDGNNGGKVVVGWRRNTNKLYIDRRGPYVGGGAAPRGFAEEFVSRDPLPLSDGKLNLRILVDNSSVEVFGGDGRVVMSTVFFPDPSDRGLRITSTGGAAKIVSLDLFELRAP